MKLSNKKTNVIAIILFFILFLISVSSIKNDALTMDELAHLPAGYSYLTQQDMRLNPEHPPLIKDVSALPLLFIKDINFPSEIKAWQEDVNGQWVFGNNLLYKSGNPTAQMIFSARITMILVLLLLGFYVFKWTRELFGNKAALISLILFSFSPTLIAHGRLVTTDVAAAIGIFVATYYFINALKKPTKKNIVIAGIVFGIAQLLKFSVILLIPFFGLLGLIWWIIKSGKLKQVIKTLVLVFVIGFILIWPIYQYHTVNYPVEKQIEDTKVYLEDTPDILKDRVLWMIEKPILKPYAQYLTGVFMVFHRVAGGNTTYFLGDISNIGWKTYFPIVYLIKVPLAFHILTLIALMYALFLIRRPFYKDIKNRIIDWTRSHFSELAMLIFIVVYWGVSIVGDLNIGVRHLIPIFPLIIVLVSSLISKWLKSPYLKLKYIIISGLIIWQIISVLSIYPHFISYFNELSSGPDNGHLYVVDSNLDWGQDLKRLKTWTDKNEVDTIYLDYFGGSDPGYILQNKYARWWGTRDPEEFPKGNYLAISASFLQGGKGEPIRDFTYSPTKFYRWLDEYTPITKIGYSIFIYYID